MNSLQQLVAGWLDCAKADERGAARAKGAEMREMMMTCACIRRVCAAELKDVLRQMKERSVADDEEEARG